MTAPIDNRAVLDVGAISSSEALTSDLAFHVASSPSELRRLVARVAEIAGPEEGWTKLLKVIAVVTYADWLEGELQVDLDGNDAGGTTIAFYSVLGVGIRERLFPPHDLNVPIDEFQRALVLAPNMCAPLKAHQGVRHLTLSMGLHVRSKDLPDFELEEKAKGDGERVTAPPPGLTLADDDVHSRSTVPPPEGVRAPPRHKEE